MKKTLTNLSIIILFFSLQNNLFAQGGSVPLIMEPSFEDYNLPDGTGDGRDSWRAPNNTNWSPFGGGATSVQISINTSNGPFPDELQAARLPETGDRVAYQEIDITPNTEYALTYYSEFETNDTGDLTVSLLKPTTTSYQESQSEENIIASRTDINNDPNIEDIFVKRMILFNSGEHETAIIFATNTGVSTRLDDFKIIINPSQLILTTSSTNGSINLNPEPINGFYDIGTEVTLTAISDLGYQFDNWWYDFSSITTNPITIMICDNIDIEAIYTESTLGIENNNFENKFSVYPNPTSDYININAYNVINIKEVIITDLNGKTVLTDRTNKSKIDISNFKSGYYFLKIKSKDNQMNIKKILKL